MVQVIQSLLGFAKWFGKVATADELIAQLRGDAASRAREREGGAGPGPIISSIPRW